MKLHELESRDARAFRQRHGETIARGALGVGGRGEQLAEAAGGEHGLRGAHLERRSVRAQSNDARDPVSVVRQRHRARVRHELDVAAGSRPLVERAMDRGSRLIAVRVQDSRQAVTRFEVQVATLRRHIESHARPLEKIDGLERLPDDDLGHGAAAGVIRGAGRIGDMQGDRIVRRERRGDASLGKLRARGIGAIGRHHQHPPRRGIERHAEPGGTGADDHDGSFTRQHAESRPAAYTSSMRLTERRARMAISGATSISWHPSRSARAMPKIVIDFM